MRSFFLGILIAGIFAGISFGQDEYSEHGKNNSLLNDGVIDTLTIETAVDTLVSVSEEPDSLMVLEEKVEILLPEPYEKVTLQGKLKMTGLPVSPSLRIFMQRDSLISISARAPFVGEAIRIDIFTDSLIAINKLNKTYLTLSGRDKVRGLSSLKLNDMQDLLLGRLFIPNHNLEEEEIDSLLEIYHEDTFFNLIPKKEARIEGVTYGIMTDEDFLPMALTVMPEGGVDTELDVVYSYNLQGYDIQLIFLYGDRSMTATLELKQPEWSGESAKSIDTGKKYREVSLSDFLRF